MGQLTRNLYVPFLDKNKGSGDTYDWVQIDKSTQFELDFGANTEDRSYICFKNDYQEVTGYSAELPQEIILDNENDLYKLMDEHIHSFPVGTDAVIPFLFVRPDLTTGEATRGLVWREAVVVGDTLNTVDGQLAFNVLLNGDPIEGTVSGIGTGKVTFTPKA